MQINVKETFCYGPAWQRLINKGTRVRNGNAACLDSCSAVTVRGTHTQRASRPRQDKAGNLNGTGSDNVYMLITCENMQQTANNNNNW